jgi:rubrerythrin
VNKRMKKEDLVNVAGQLYCSIILEEKTAKAYKSYSERAENPLFKMLLLFIANDSFKHAKTLRSLCKCISKSPISAKECPKILGKAWKEATTFAEKESSKTGKLTNEELCAYIDDMISLENVMSEEYLAVLHLKIVQFQTIGVNIGGFDFQKILGYIIEDEARHKVLLDRIRQLSKQPETKSTGS